MSFGSSVRRGRELLSDEQMWGNSGRPVHRRIEDQAGACTEDMFKRVVEQLHMDQSSMQQMQEAIGVMKNSMNVHTTQVAEGYSNLERQLQEQIQMRMDTTRRHEIEAGHLRSGGGNLKEQHIKLP